MYFAFEHSGYLWYLLSIPLLIISHFAFLKYTRKRAIQFANFQALKRVSEQHILTKNYTLLIIRTITLLCIILALAGTTFYYMGDTNNNDFIIALDISSSMSAKDFTSTRLDAAKEYVKTFIDNVESDSAFGVVTFAGVAFIEQLPTRDHSEVKQAIDNINLADVGGTDIPAAIITSTNLLLPSKNGKTIILLTDGSNTVSFFNKDPVSEGIAYARLNNVVIHAIGLGTNSGPIGYLPEYYNVSAIYDEDSLVRLTNETGGQYYYAENNQELSATYNDILDDVRKAYIGIELQTWLMTVGLLLIFFEWALISTRFRGLP